MAFLFLGTQTQESAFVGSAPRYSPYSWCIGVIYFLTNSCETSYPRIIPEEGFLCRWKTLIDGKYVKEIGNFSLNSVEITKNFSPLEFKNIPFTFINITRISGICSCKQTENFRCVLNCFKSKETIPMDIWRIFVELQ